MTRLVWGTETGYGIDEDLTVQQEFNWLRMNPKWSKAQALRVKHLEDHLDKGDVFCKCYKEKEKQ